MSYQENGNMLSQESLVSFNEDYPNYLTNQVTQLFPPIPDYSENEIVDIDLDGAMSGYQKFFNDIEKISQEAQEGGGPLSDNLKAFWGGVYLTHIEPILNEIKGAPAIINEMTKTQIKATIESIKNASSERRFLFVIKLLQIIVICGTNRELITEIVSTIARIVASSSTNVANTMIPLMLPILYYASYYAGIKKFGKALISLRLIVYELIFGSQLQVTITVGSYIIYKYLDDTYGAQIEEASQDAATAFQATIQNKKMEIEKAFNSTFERTKTTLSPGISALVFFMKSNDEFIMLLSNNIIDTAKEVESDIDSIKEMYNYYVAIGRNDPGPSKPADNSDNSMFEHGVNIVNRHIPQTEPKLTPEQVAEILANMSSSNNTSPSSPVNPSGESDISNKSNRLPKRRRIAVVDGGPTATSTSTEGGKRRIKRKHKKTHKKSHKKHHKKKTTRRKMIKVRKTKARKSKLHKKKSGKHTKKHKKH